MCHMMNLFDAVCVIWCNTCMTDGVMHDVCYVVDASCGMCCIVCAIMVHVMMRHVSCVIYRVWCMAYPIMECHVSHA